MATCGLIFVADDGEDGKRISELLGQAGYASRTLRSGDEVLAAAAEQRPALVVLGVRLKGLNGYEVCNRLRAAYGDAVRIVFVSAERTEPYDQVAGFLIGADDYIVKPFDPAELVARIRRLIERSPSVEPPRLTGPLESLTKREHEVLTLLSGGRRASQIADELVISPATVATHIQNVLKKLDVHDRAQAVAVALQAGGDEAVANREARPATRRLSRSAA